LVDRTETLPIWPQGCAYAITTALAIQADVASTLSATRWDLLIADEQPGTDTAYGKLLTRLLVSTKKALIIASPKSGHETAAPESVTVKWNLQEMVDQAGRSIAPPPPRFITIEFKADQDLQMTAGQLQTAAAASNADVPSAFVDAAASSPAALERAIESYMARGSVEGEELNPAVDGASQPQELEPEFRAALLSANQALQGSSEDQKARALISLLKRILNEVPRPRICVTTRFTSTAYYLSAVLEAEGLPGAIAVASAHGTDLREIIETFLESPTPNILVATRAAVTLETRMRRITDLIFYEPLIPTPQVDKVIGQVNAIGRKEELRVYEMKPV
jgi:hypothetical protein